jgi:hypothetical protein
MTHTTGQAGETMRAITNEARIARGARLGKIATIAGLGFLLGGLIISLVTQGSPVLWLSLVCLALGLLVSSIGTFNMNRWVREPRADQALAQSLKGFDDRYQLYNYLLPAPHVLLSPTGLFVLTAMGQDGVIRCEGDKFRRDFSVGRVFRFMADEGLGKPFVEGDQQVGALKEYLEENEIEMDQEVDIQNVLVFHNPRAQLVLSDPSRPVVIPKALKRAIRKKTDARLSSARYAQLEELFERESS